MTRRHPVQYLPAIAAVLALTVAAPAFAQRRVSFPPAEAPPPPEDIQLLREIRDELKKR